MKVRLVSHDKSTTLYYLSGNPTPIPTKPPAFNRIAYAAAHVVLDPTNVNTRIQKTQLDWDATLAFRHHLWNHGFKVAEAMDTSQRGMGVSWELAAELIKRSVAESKTVPGADLACGAGTDQTDTTNVENLDEVINAYTEQFELIEKCGGRAIMMASRSLAHVACSADDYKEVYNRVIGQAQDKVILHWLGEMFDPNLKGYWGSDSFKQNLETVLEIINNNVDKIDGIKISLLDAKKEIELRRRLPESVICYTGDDNNYAELIQGDERGYSHALLGIFDAIAPAASAALSALAENDISTFKNRINDTVPLSRKIFEYPTQFYKSGIVFLAWLNGHQDHFQMPDEMQSRRSIPHYCDIFRLADQANILDKPEMAVDRLTTLLSRHNVNT